jgi:accessory gene regulator B
MVSLNRLANKLAASIAAPLNLNGTQIEIIGYGLVVFLLLIVNILLISLVAYLLGVLFPTLIICLSSFTLRRVSGGGHCSAPWRCILFSVILLPLFGVFISLLATHCSNSIIDMLYILFACISLVIIYQRAPLLSSNKPIAASLAVRLRIYSIIATLVITIAGLIFLLNDHKIVGIALVVGIFWQSMSLHPLMVRLINAFDRLMHGNLRFLNQMRR